MGNKYPIKCVLDTNVIYPLWLRDILLWFAFYDLFIPKWSSTIFDEWIRVMHRKGINHREALRRVKVMNDAFPDAQVKNYESIISSLDLPDQNDRHVLAAAIRSKSSFIITRNLKDFPSIILNPFGIQAVSPDLFLSALVKIYPIQTVLAFRKLVKNKTRPLFTEEEVLLILQKNNLRKTAKEIKLLLDLQF